MTLSITLTGAQIKIQITRQPESLPTAWPARDFREETQQQVYRLLYGSPLLK